MESPPMGRYIFQPSNKRRVFPGSSSSYKDSGIAEVSPIIDWSSKSKSLKQKEIIGLEVTHVDVEGDSGDVMFVDDIVDQNYKGKEALSDCSYNDSDSAKVGTVDVQSSGRGPVVGLRKSSDLEGFNNEFPYHDDEYMDAYHDDLTYDREYALQAHFDSRDIPTGVEVPVPWFLVPADTEKHSSTVNSSNNGSSSIDIDTPMADSSNYWGLPDFAKAGSVSTSTSNSSLQTDLEKLNSPYNLDLTLSSPFIEPDLHFSNSAGSASSTYSNSLAEMGVLSYPHAIRPQFVPPYFFGETMPPTHGSTANYTLQAQVCAVRPSSGFHPSFKGSKVHSSRMKSVGNGSPTYSLVPSMFPMPPPPPSVGTFMPSWHGDSVYLSQSSFASGDIYTSADAVPFSPEKDLIVHFVQDPASSEKSSTAAGSSAVPFGSMSHIEKHVNENEILEKFQNFKQFETIQDFSDHYYFSWASAVKQPPKNWAKRIQEEWRILEKDLPDTILVRVYESRMDLLRAVIVGAEGTPYHDGLFFFDIFFPSGYPNVPPQVHYHSGGLRINPNLYNCGKVCLSLLNTWSGSQNEKWIPGVSTMLQVLVSIQALILNENPYFNEPGYEDMSGLPSGDMYSQHYNENVFTLSLKTMVYAMRKPPEHFEDFVVGHFFRRAQDILLACEAYLEGARVGCLAEGGAQSSDAVTKSCSDCFKDALASYMPVLVQTFSQVGAKDCEKFLSLADKGNSRVSSLPVTSNLLISKKLKISRHK